MNFVGFSNYPLLFTHVAGLFSELINSKQNGAWEGLFHRTPSGVNIWYNITVKHLQNRA